MRTAKALFFALAGLVAGGLVFHSGLRKFKETRQLKREGAVVEAKVVDERTRYRSKGRSRHYLTVEFSPTPNQTVTREIQVDDDTHSQGATDGRVQVHYLPSNPEILRAGTAVEIEFGDMLLGGFILACGAGSFLFLRQPTTRRELAEDAARNLDALGDAEQQLVPVDGRTFTRVDLKFYDAARQAFEARGFVFLADVEVIASKPVKGHARTFVRLLLSPDRIGVASIFHVRPGFFLRMLGAREARVCGVDAQMSDHSFVCTDNAGACSALNNPPEINAAHLPAASTVEMILDAHAGRLEAHGVFRINSRPVAMQGTEDVLRSIQLQNRIKAAYRRQNGLSREELERLAGVKNNEIVNNLHADLESRREESSRKAA